MYINDFLNVTNAIVNGFKIPLNLTLFLGKTVFFSVKLFCTNYIVF